MQKYPIPSPLMKQSKVKMAPSKHYESGLQYVSTDTPLDDIIYLLKRDGGIVLRNLISADDIDKASAEIKDRLEQDLE